MTDQKSTEPNAPCSEVLDGLDDSVDADFENADFDAPETNAKEDETA